MFLAVFQGIGPLELAIVLVIVLVIFGPKRLPALGRQLGSGMREFRDSIRSREADDIDATDPRAPATATIGRTEPAARPADDVVSERR